MKEQILTLRAKGYSYAKIQDELGCSKGTISYYLGDGQKEKTLKRNQTRRTKDVGGIITAKIDRFLHKTLAEKSRSFQRRSGSKLISKADIQFRYTDVIAKFGEHPVCAYTGEVLDWSEPSSYNFDHIVPASKGGDNTIDNLAICSSKANAVKSDMTPEELLAFCKQVVQHMDSNP